MKKVFFLLFLTACTTTSNNFINDSINFDNDFTYEEYKVLLEKYNENIGYPDIDK